MVRTGRKIPVLKPAWLKRGFYFLKCCIYTTAEGHSYDYKLYNDRQQKQNQKQQKQNQKQQKQDREKKRSSKLQRHLHKQDEGRKKKQRNKE